MSTRSGRKCSISDVSTSPPWMPWRSSSSLYMPAGRPKRCQLVFTASILWRTRSSRLTMPMISSLPPCELTNTILLHAGARDRRAELGPGFDQRCGRQRQRARRMQMLVRLADRLDRQDADVEVVGQDGDHLVQHALHDRRVGRDRQMRPVLLDRGDRQHGDRRLAGRSRRIRWCGSRPTRRALAVIFSTAPFSRTDVTLDAVQSQRLLSKPLSPRPRP